MATLTNSQIFSTAANPGAPAGGSGPTWPPGQWDHLPLPFGAGTIGKTDTDSLRRIFARINLDADVHHACRDVLCQRYRDLLNKIGSEGSDKAIRAWLAKQT